MVYSRGNNWAIFSRNRDNSFENKKNIKITYQSVSFDQLPASIKLDKILVHHFRCFIFHK